MKHVLKVTFVASTLVLGGCSNLFGKSGYFRDKGGDYAEAQISPGLVVPENLNAAPRNDIMVIPPINDGSAVGNPDTVPRSGRRVVRSDGAAVQVASVDGVTRMMINNPPEDVWKQVLGYWERNGVEVVEKDPANGVIVTDWFVLGDAADPGVLQQLFNGLSGSGDDKNLAKFRVRVEQGESQQSSNVFLDYARRSATGDLSAPVTWSAAATVSDELELKVFNEMLVYMAQNDEPEVVSLQTEKLNVSEQTSLVKDGNGNPVLRIEQNFARSWQSVEAALSKTGIKVLDKNRSAGLIFVSLPGNTVAEKEDEKGGWLSGVFKSSDDKKPVDPSAYEYRIRVQNLGSATNVTLEKDLNTLPPVELSEELLSRLRKNMG